MNASTRDTPDPADAALDAIRQALDGRLYGKPRVVRLALTCLLAEGHLLIDDVPGVGKTTLAQALAQVFDLAFSRVQFTSDLLPSDILGVSIYDPAQAAFDFRPGPIFTQLLLADEINRASPRTQSALLEAMAESQVTVEGETRPLATPFCVVATQNPTDHNGTFALPDSQLDRFLMRLAIGYPDVDAERQLLSGQHPTKPLALLPLADGLQLRAWQQAVAGVVTRDALIDYLLALIARTREDAIFTNGLSPRGGLALRRAAQAWAFLAGRDHVLPDDVQAVLPAVVDHRLSLSGRPEMPASQYLLEQVDV